MQRSIGTLCIVLFALVFLTSSARAQAQLPASAPASAPTTRPRYQAVAPPGFKRIAVDGRPVLLQDVDQKWVTEAIESRQPTTRPTTMPSDLLEHLNAKRAALKAQIVKDLGLSDPSVVDKFFDERLVKAFKTLDELDPQIVYLVTTPAMLKDIVKNGWQDPRFRFNRAADQVEYNPSVSVSANGAGGDDSVLPALYEPDFTVDDRKIRFQRLIANAEGEVMNDVAIRAQRIAWMAFMQLIGEQAMSPLKPRPDQQWFVLGTASVLSSRYAAELIGTRADDIIAGLITEDPRNPIRLATIDLTHPADASQLRQEYIRAYTDAFNRRAVRAGQSLLTQASDGAVAKIVAAWKQNPPADGAALVILIKQTTNVDMAEELQAH